MPSAAVEFARLWRLSPKAAVAYMRRRGLLSPTYDWRDLWQDEHAYQFTVSRLARLDLLQAVHEAVTASVAGDLSRTDFVRDVRATLAKSGWWGDIDVTDPDTGEVVTTRFDVSRLKLIYDVNTSMAHSAGLWNRVQTNKLTHPYLRYITKRDGRVRPAHRSWDRVTLPVDDPFWATHTPPNGWRCRCWYTSMTRAEYDGGVTPTGAPLIKDAPPVEMREWLDKRNGVTREVPVGIDPGFAYNPGVASARAASLQEAVAAKLSAVPAPLAGAATRAGMHPPKQ